MTFTIHLIFTPPSGMIFRPLLFMFCFLSFWKKITFVVFSSCCSKTCFMTSSKLKIVFNILNIHCLLGFYKMTFTIHLIFTAPAGIIFRPLFTTFCLCFVIIFLEKITFVVFSSCCSTRCFMNSSKLKIVSSLFSIIYHTVCML